MHCLTMIINDHKYNPRPLVVMIYFDHFDKLFVFVAEGMYPELGLTYGQLGIDDHTHVPPGNYLLI